MKSICVKNVKTLENTGIISLSPVTLLVGKNSSGKSTFLRTFPLIKQSIRKSTDGPLLWAGDVDDYVDFGSFSETITNGNSDKTIDFQFNFSLNLRRNNYYLRSLQEALKNDNKIHEVKYTISISQMGNKEYVSCLSVLFCQTEFIFKFYPNPNEIEVFVDNVKMQIQKKSLKNKIVILPFSNGYRSVFGFQLPPIGVFLSSFSKSSSMIETENINLSLENFGLNEFFLPFTGREIAMQIVGECLCKNIPLQAFNRDRNDSSKKDDKEIIDYIFKIVENLQKINDEQNSAFFKLVYFYGCFSIMDSYINAYFRQVHYIAPLRATAERYYRLRNLSIDEVDYQGKNLAIFLDGLRRTDQLKAFNQWTDDLLGFHVQTKNDSGHLSIQVADRGKNESTNLSDTGFGFSQILPIVTQLWKISNKKKINGSKSYWDVPFVLAVEQPELHLHPALQASLVEAFINAIKIAKKNKCHLQLILETHSETIVNYFGKSIAENKIDSKEVSVILFDKVDNNLTRVQVSEFNQQGYLCNWPIGFFAPRM